MATHPLKWDAEISSGHPKDNVVTALGPWDFLGMITGLILTIAATCVLSRGRIFWEDELLGWLLLRDPSWHHMLAAWKLGADGDGLAFLLTGRAWFHLFGSSEISFRLYSSTCFGLAFVVLWMAGRRFYNAGTVALALFYAYFFSPTIVMHMTEGRFYGLEVLSAALVVWLALIIMLVPGKLPWHLYFATFAVHTLLTTSHILGVVYSGFVLSAIVAVDLHKRQVRPLLYLSAAAGWLFLLPERTAIIASAQVGKPHFWTTQPTKREFIRAFFGGSDNIALLLLLLTCAVLITLWLQPDGRAQAVTAIRKRMPIYAVALALLLIPIILYVHGFVGTPLMVDRYLQPVVIALFFWVAEGLQLIDPLSHMRKSLADPRFANLTRVTVAVCFGILVLSRVFHHFKEISFSPKNYTEALTQRLPKGIPVVCDDAYTFTELLAGQHAAGINYVFLLDWKQSIGPTAPHGEVTEFHLMENLKKAGYFSNQIEDFDSFLKRNNNFLVIDVESISHSNNKPAIGNPIAQRMRTVPGYDVKEYTEMNRDWVRYEPVRYKVWQVCRGDCDLQANSKLP